MMNESRLNIQALNDAKVRCKDDWEVEGEKEYKNRKEPEQQLMWQYYLVRSEESA